MWLLYISALLPLTCGSARGWKLLQSVEVPQYAFAGGEARLGCRYNLRTTRLYSLKWYHNNTEFYRYVPTERAAPFHVHTSPAFTVTEVRRNELGVEVSLKRLRVSGSGHYRCEVIAEHPTFRTETASATMLVLSEALSPPVLEGGKEMYDKGDIIEVRCRLARPPIPAHTPSLTWIIDGRQVGPNSVEPFVTQHGIPGLTLALPASTVLGAGGRVESECRAGLGSHQRSAHKTLRVRVRLISYIHTHRSAADTRTAMSAYLWVYLLPAALLQVIL